MGTPKKRQKEQSQFIPLVTLSVLVALIGIIALSGPLTGLLVKEDLLTYQQALDVDTDQSTRLTFTLEQHPDLFSLRSLGLDGTIIGNGTVKIYLQTSNESFLILDSEQLTQELSGVTGFSVDVAEEFVEESPQEPEESVEEVVEQEEIIEQAPEEPTQEVVEEQTDSVEDPVVEEIIEEPSSEPEMDPEVEQEPVEEVIEPENNATEEEPVEEEQATQEVVEEIVNQTQEEVQSNETQEQLLETDSNETQVVDNTTDSEVNQTEPIFTLPVNTTDNVTHNETEQTFNETENAPPSNESQETQEPVEQEEPTPEVPIEPLPEPVPEEPKENRADFQNHCIESCLFSEVIQDTQYTLVIEVENAQVKLTNLIYSVTDLTPDVNVQVDVKSQRDRFLTTSIDLEGNNSYGLDNGAPADIEPGTYDLTIAPTFHAIKSIQVENTSFFEERSIKLQLDQDLPVQEAKQSFAIKTSEPIKANLISKASRLLFCSDWSFSAQRCRSQFFPQQELEPGEQYRLEVGIGSFAWIETESDGKNLSYLKVKDDPRYDAIIDSTNLANGTLTINFHHDSIELLPIQVVGRISNYQLDTTISGYQEPVTLQVFNYTDEFFRIKVGAESEVFNFGKRRKVKMNAELKNSKDEKVNSSLELIDSLTKETVLSELNGEKEIDEGLYDIVMRTTNNPIEEIELENVEIFENASEFLKIEDVNESSSNLTQFVEVYSIDPTALNFTSANVTVTATGTSLYKCKDWNFTTQTCFGDWELFKTGLVPGETYTFTLTPDDPGFGEFGTSSHQGTVEDMLVYRGAGDTSIPEFKTRNTSGFSVEGTALDVTSALQYVKVLAHPNGTNPEKVLCTKDGGGDINCQVWNGTDWGNLVEHSVASGTNRAFDVAYQSISGEPIACYRENSVDSSIPQCSIWNGLTWSADAGANDVTSPISTIKLIPDPNSDYVAMITKDTADDINVQIWNGTVWTNLLEVDDSAGTCDRCSPYHGSWESSGDFIGIWFDTVDDELESREFSKTTGWAAQVDGAITGLGTGNNMHVLSQTNPQSANDEILVAVTDDDNKLTANSWDGSSWGTQQEISSNIGAIAATNHPFYLAYEQSGDFQAILTYGVSSADLNYSVWNGTNWGAQLNLPAAVEDKDWHQLASHQESDRIMLTTVGITNDVDTLEWNGTSWDAAWTSHETSSNDVYWNAWFTYGSVEANQSPGNASLNLSIRNSTGAALNVTFAIVNPAGITIFNNTGLSHMAQFPKGKHKFHIVPQNHEIQEIIIENLSVQMDFNELIDIEQGSSGEGFLFSVNPLFNDTNITIIANGTPLPNGTDGFRALEKCTLWNFSTSTCSGNFTQVAVLKNDGTYEFKINSLDPGFRETVSSCAAEDLEGTKGTFAGACDDPTGALIEQDDGTIETHTFGKNTYSGLEIQSVNTTITDCQSVDDVFICFESWTTNIGGTAADCDVSVDANAGVSYTAVTTVCPGTTANPGVTCTNVTALETWTCANFFGAAGTRAQAKMENDRTQAGGGTTETLSTDVFFFNVTYTAIVDTTAPLISNVNHSGITNQSAVINWTTNETSNTSVNYGTTTDLGTINAVDDAVTQHNRNLSGLLNNTQYFYNVTSCDTSANCATSGPFNFTTLQNAPPPDTQAPGFSNLGEFPTDPAAYSAVQIYSFNITWIDNVAVDTVTIEFNGINFTDSTQSGNNYNKTFGPLPAGTHNYTWYANDTSGNQNNTGTQTYTINQAVSAVNLLLDGTDANITVEAGSTVNITGQRTAGERVIQLFQDGTLINSGIGTLENLTLFNSVGVFNITVLYPATQNFTTSFETHFITVQDTTRPSVSTIQPTSANEDTLTNYNATVTDNVAVTACNLFIDGIDNGSMTILGSLANKTVNIANPGLFQFLANCTDAAGNINDTSNTTITINDITPPTPTNLGENPTDPATYSAGQNYSFNITWTDNVAVDVVTIEFNGINFTDSTQSGNNYNKTFGPLPAGVHNYTWHANDTSGNQNNTGIQTYSVNQAASAVNLLLNGVDNNITVEVGSTVNLTGQRTTGESIIQLFNNGTLINSGVGPLENLTLFNTLGVFNITVQYPTTQNFSASFETHFITVQDTISPSVFDVQPQANTTVNLSDAIEISANVTDNLAVDQVSANITLPNSSTQQLNLSLATGNKYNASFTLPSDIVGRYNISYVANDTSGNQNASETSFFIANDATRPSVSTIQPISANEDTLVSYNATISDNIGVTACNLFINGTNNGSMTISGSLANKTVSIGTPGTFQFLANCTDAAGNVNDTSTTTITINDITAPVISNVNTSSITNQTALVSWTTDESSNTSVNFGITVALGNISAANDAVLNHSRSLSGLSNNTQYFYNVTSCDTSGNCATQGPFNFTTQQNAVGPDIQPPGFSNIVEFPTDPATYAEAQNYQFNITWVDNTAVDTVILEFDGVNFTDVGQVGNVYSRNFSELVVGVHNYTWFANDTSGNENNSGVQTYTLNQATDVVSLFLNGVQNNLTITYPQQINASANSTSDTEQLFRNGSIISDPELVVLAAGSYNYSTNSTGNENYTPAVPVTYILTVNQAASAVNLLLDGTDANITVEIGSTVNLTGQRTTGESIIQLFNNGTLINTGIGPLENLTTFNTLGVFNITVTQPATQNFSASFETHFITVQDTTQPSVSTLQPTSANEDTLVNYNATVTDNVGVTACNLFIDGTNNGSMTILGSLANKTVNIANPGLFQFLANCTDAAGNINDTSNTTITINDITPPTSSNLGEFPTDPATYSAGQNYSFNITWIDNVAVDAVTIEFNGINFTDSTPSGNNYNKTFGPLPAGTHNYTWYANDTSGNQNNTGTQTYTINQATDVVSLFLNGNQSNLSVSYPTQTNASANATSVTEQLFRNGSLVTNPEITVLAAGSYNYSTNSTGNENYTPAVPVTYILTVNKAASTVNLLLNGLDNNLTIEAGSTVNITGQKVAGEGNIQLFQDGTLINSGVGPLENLTTFNTLGAFNITLTHPATQNFTSFFETHFITTQDTIAPAVFGLVPTAGSVFDTNETVEIATNVTDIIGVDTVQATIILPNGTNQQVGLTSVGGDKYNISFTIPLLLGQYNITYSANDTSGNLNNTETSFFTVVDVFEPTVIGVVPTSGSSFNVTDTIELAANVTDNLGVNIVRANVTLPNASTNIQSLSLSVDSKYNTSFIIPNLTGRYNVTYLANDSSGNLNDTETTFFFGIVSGDIIPPNVTILTPLAGTKFQINDSVNISATVRDENALSSVLAEVTKPNGSASNVSMSASGDNYSVLFNDLTQKGNYSIKIIATDPSNNVNDTQTTGFVRISPANKSFDVVSSSGQPINFSQGILNNASGLLDVQLNFTGLSVESMIIFSYNESTPFNVITIENATADSNLFNDTYAIDLSNLTFATANVTLTAKGNTIYKCTNFSIGSVTCNDGYEHLLNVTPGQQYTITLNSTDPGFGDSSPDNGTPDAGVFYGFGDGFSSIANTFTATQVDDQVYFAVRRSNGGGSQLDLGAFVNLTYNITNLTSQGLLPQKITNLSFLSNYCFNDDVNGPFTCGGSGVEGTPNNPHQAQLLNISSGQFQTIGTYNVSAANPNEVTSIFEALSGFGDFVSPANLITIRYNANITISANGNDAAFGVDFAPLTITFDFTRPNVTGLLPVANTTFNTSDSIELAANVTDNNLVDTVRANVTLPNGTAQLTNLSLGAGTKYNASFTIPIVEGRYNLTIIANDTVNNTNNTETTFFNAFTPDLVAPAIAFVGPTPANGTLQSSTSFTVNVSVTDNTAVDICTLEFDGVNESMTKIGAGASVTCNTTKSGLSDGTHTYRVFANDTSGNTNFSETRTITIDTTPPTPSSIVEFPTDPATYSAGQFYQFNATWTDAVAVDNVTLEFDGIIYTDIGQVGNVYSRNFTDLFAGLHNYTWFANDTLGNQNTTGVQTYTVNQAASAVNLLLDGTDANITVEVGSTINITGQRVTGEGNIQLFQDGTLINSGVGPLENLTLFNTLGIFNITVFYATTQNFTTSLETHFITVQDTTPPSVFDLIPPADSNFSTSQFIELAANVTDIVGVSVVIANVTLPNGTQQIVSISNAVGNKFNSSFNLSLVGQHNMTIQANDTNDNRNHSSTTFFILLAPTPQPDISLTKVDNPDPVQNGSLLNYTITITNNGSGLARNVTLTEQYPPQTTFISSSPAPSQGNNVFSLGNLTASSATTVNITVNVSTTAAQDITNQINVTFENLTSTLSKTRQENTTVILAPDTTPPQVFDILPTQNTSFNTSKNIEIGANITDNVAVSSASVNISLPNGTIQTLALTNAIGDKYNLTFAISLVGQHNVSYFANDTSGNVNNTESTFFISVDQSPPVISNLTIAPGLPLQNNQSQQNVSVNFSSNEFPINITFTLRNETGILINSQGPVTLNASGDLPVSYVIPANLSPSNYTLVMNTTDFFDNRNITTLGTIEVIDITAPKIGAVVVIPSLPLIKNVSEKNITVNFSSSEFLIRVNFSLYNSAGTLSDTQGPTLINVSTQLPITYTIPSGLAVDNYTLNMSVADQAFNNNNTPLGTIEVTSAAAIVKTNITPKGVINGSPVNLFISAINIDSVWANITLPDATEQMITLTNNANTSFANTVQLGRYNVSFFANNSVGDVVSAGGFFESFLPLTFNVTVIDSNGTGVNSTWEALFRDEIIDNNASGNGTYIEQIISTVVDLRFTAFENRIQLLLVDLNVSSENNKQIGLDKHSDLVEFLVTYGVNSTFNFTNATIKIFYDDSGFSDESLLELQRCDDYNFAARTCNTAFTDITSQATQNTAEDSFEVVVTSFSAFSIRQATAPPPPTAPPTGPSGGGGSRGGGGSTFCTHECQDAELECLNAYEYRQCALFNGCNKWFSFETSQGVVCQRDELVHVEDTLFTCLPAWECSDWGECGEDGMQHRECVDHNDCELDMTREIEERQCRITIKSIVEPIVEQPLRFYRALERLPTIITLLLFIISIISVIITRRRWYLEDRRNEDIKKLKEYGFNVSKKTQEFLEIKEKPEKPKVIKKKKTPKTVKTIKKKKIKEKSKKMKEEISKILKKENRLKKDIQQLTKGGFRVSKKPQEFLEIKVKKSEKAKSSEVEVKKPLDEEDVKKAKKNEENSEPKSPKLSELEENKEESSDSNQNEKENEEGEE